MSANPVCLCQGCAYISFYSNAIHMLKILGTYRYFTKSAYRLPSKVFKKWIKNMLGARSYKYSRESNAAERLHQLPKLACNSKYQRCLHIPKTYFEGMSQSLFKLNSENLALKDFSSFDSPRYDCVFFMSLIKLNGECFNAKNLQYSDCVLFMSS